MQRDDTIRILGPIDLLTSSGSRSVGGRNARHLLGALVVAGGRSVSTDYLRWAIWGENPPRSSDASLQTYIARLRRLLGRETIEYSDHCYRLVVERGQIDALRFEDLLVAAGSPRDDPERCQRSCVEGLALWRGDPFGDLVDDEPFRLESSRLQELRVSMTELALECELLLGPPNIIAAELESAVEEHPYREHLWYLLIEALVRSDRRVEALRACRRLRDALAAAGLEPDEQLQRMETEILRAGHIPPDVARWAPASLDRRDRTSGAEPASGEP